MKERIRHILREEQSREERLRSRIISIIRGAGLSQAISSVGGVNNLIRILGVENSMKFLNLFNDMDENELTGLLHAKEIIKEALRAHSPKSVD